MWDIAMIALGITFFVIAIAYVHGCDLLSPKHPHGEAGK